MHECGPAPAGGHSLTSPAAVSRAARRALVALLVDEGARVERRAGSPGLFDREADLDYDIHADVGEDGRRRVAVALALRLGDEEAGPLVEWLSACGWRVTFALRPDEFLRHCGANVTARAAVCLAASAAILGGAIPGVDVAASAGGVVPLLALGAALVWGSARWERARRVRRLAALDALVREAIPPGPPCGPGRWRLEEADR